MVLDRSLLRAPREGTIARRASIWAGGAALLIVFVVQFWLWRDFIIEDTYISLVYVKNLLAGRGLTYNGIVVEGFSNLLWVLVVYLVALPLGDPLLAAKCAAFLCGAAILLLLPRLGAALPGSTRTGVLAALLVTLNFSFMAWLTSGMEVPLLALLLVVVTIAIYRHLPAWLIALLIALVSITRPDGFVFLPMLVVGDFVLYRDWRRALRIVLCYAIFYGGVLIWRYARYHDFFPATVYAKSGPLAVRLVQGRRYFDAFLRAHRIPVALGALGTIFVLARLWAAFLQDRQQRSEEYRTLLDQALRLVPVLGVVAGFTVVVILEGGDWMPALRFFAPLMPLMFIYLVSVLWLATRGAPAWLFYGLVALLLLKEGAATIGVRPSIIAAGRNTVVPLEHLGRWLRQHADPADTLAVVDAGAIPYYSELKTLDLVGLNDAHIAHLPGGLGGKVDVEYVLGHEPDYVEIHVRRSLEGRAWTVYDDLGSMHLFFHPEFQRWYDLVTQDVPYQHFRRSAEPKESTFLDDYYRAELDVAPVGVGAMSDGWCLNQHATMKVMVRNEGTGAWAAAGVGADAGGVVELSYHFIHSDGHLVEAGRRPLPRDLGPGEAESLVLRLPPVSSPGTATLHLDLFLVPLWPFSAQGQPVTEVAVPVVNCS